ncbi:MAG: hypothetical protein HYY24_10885 [Verrucomicrobia bacterium]|nr:hypothetical protein [Verrucomicrobiota bacterium]
MQLSKLTCPHCQSPYPLWRVIIGFRSYVCPCCKTKLAFTIESAQRLGATGGLVSSAVLMPIVFIRGADVIRSWPFWVFLIVFGYFTGGVVAAFVCRFAPYEQVRASAKGWRLFPNVSQRHRRFLFLEFTVIPACVILLLFARSLPIWLVLAVSLVVIVVGIFGSIASWHLFFGERGIFRRWRSDDAP